MTSAPPAAHLERDIQLHARAAEAAPPGMVGRIDAHRQAAAERARQAEQDQAGGHH